MPTSAEMMHPRDATPLDELPGGMEHAGGEPMPNEQMTHEVNLGSHQVVSDPYARDEEGQVVNTEESAKDVTLEGKHGMQDGDAAINADALNPERLAPAEENPRSDAAKATKATKAKD
jgi:hypothetical protein